MRRQAGFVSALVLVLTVVLGGHALGNEIVEEASAADKEKGPEGKLVILTSYPKHLTDEFRRAFEKKYPAVEVEVLKKKTGAGIKHLKTNREQNFTDLFWVSAPAAMEMLKSDSLLAHYVPQSPGLPKYVASFPVNDHDGFYSGFAASGYGIMWNERYLQAKGLPDPTDWKVLASPEYFGHVGMSSPSRSGTTHLAVEAMLQGYGWTEGWKMVQGIGGNLSQVTAKSSGVPKGVEVGEFGAGVVIDFYGLGSRARRYPVDFAYPKVTTIVPANIALVENAPNPKAAKAFIEFLLSESGQTLLLNERIRRLPIRPEIYNRAADDFPNPFEDKALGSKLQFDVAKSKGRYPVVNALFDVMVTFNFSELKQTTAMLNLAQSQLERAPEALRGEVGPTVLQAKALMQFVPISEEDASNPEFVSIFQKKRKKSTDKLSGKQAEIELGWQNQVKDNYVQARELLTVALKQLNAKPRLSLAPVDK